MHQSSRYIILTLTSATLTQTIQQIICFIEGTEITDDNCEMANLFNDEHQALIDWEECEDDRKVFQKLLKDLDDLLDTLHARMNESASDEDGKASVPPPPEDRESGLAEGQDVPDIKTSFLPKRSPGRSPEDVVQQRCGTEKEERKQDEKDFQTTSEENDAVQKVKHGQWPMSEIKEDPESPQFLLRWPPEGSVFVSSGGAEPHHS